MPLPETTAGNQQHIKALTQMREEARLHYNRAVRGHYWRATQDKWHGRMCALDAALAALEALPE